MAKIKYINAGGIGFSVSSEILYKHKIYDLILNASLPEKSIELKLKIAIIGVKGNVYRAVFRQLSREQLTAIGEISSCDSDSVSAVISGQADLSIIIPRDELLSCANYLACLFDHKHPICPDFADVILMLEDCSLLMAAVIKASDSKSIGVIADDMCSKIAESVSINDVRYCFINICVKSTVEETDTDIIFSTLAGQMSPYVTIMICITENDEQDDDIVVYAVSGL